MYAVVVEIDTNGADMDAALENLKTNVVPRLREAGASAAYWLAGAPGAQHRVSFMVYDTEEAARAQADVMKVGETPPGAPKGITVRSVEVSEVVASL